MNKHGQQVARFESYVAMDPSNPTLWVGFGDVLHQAGLFERAAQAFQTSLQLQPSNAVAQARLAAVALSRNDFTLAETLLQSLVDAGERDPAVLFNLGLSLYYQRKFVAAAAVFEPLMQLPTIVDAAYYLVSCLHNLNQLEDAIAKAQLHLQRNSSTKLRGLLALVLLDASRMTEAIAQAEQVMLLQPDNPDAAAVLSTHCIETQNMQRAQHHLQIVTAREPDNVRGWQGLALVALYEQRHQEAVAHLERARHCDPENTGTLTTLGWTYLSAHEYPNAEAVFRAGLAIDRNDAELHGGLATALVMQRKLDDAKQCIARAFKLDRRCFGAVYAQSIILRLAGQQRQSTQLMASMLQHPLRDDGSTLLDSLVQFWKTQKTARPSDESRSDNS